MNNPVETPKKKSDQLLEQTLANAGLLSMSARSKTSLINYDDPSPRVDQLDTIKEYPKKRKRMKGKNFTTPVVSEKNYMKPTGAA